MKKFVVSENQTVFIDLTQISGIKAYQRTVECWANGSYFIVCNAESHADACKFAEKLAAEVDAAKSGKAIPAKDFSVTEKTTKNKVADDDEKPITDIYGRTFEPIQISALYINEFGDVRAVISDDDIVILKQFENTEKDNAYIDALAKRCGFYTVTKFNLYVDPVTVRKVYIDDDGNYYNVCVQVYDFDLPPCIYNDIGEALAKLKELKKAFDL